MYGNYGLRVDYEDGVHWVVLTKCVRENYEWCALFNEVVFLEVINSEVDCLEWLLAEFKHVWLDAACE